MKECTNFEFGAPKDARGHICIDLTDPISGRVEKRVEGENHVFKDFIFAQECNNYSLSTWVDTLSNIGTYLVLTDSSAAISDAMPFILGNVIGYGVPNQGSSGTYCGAYNSANQVLAAVNGNSVRWKFQYDFTTAQANGTINTIGLTSQYYTYGRIPAMSYPYTQNVKGNSSATCDGRYVYYISTEGVITKADNLSSAYTTIDVSAVVGTTGADTKYIAFDVSTGCYYVYVHNASTAANRKLYKFSDATFGTLLTAYSVSNLIPPNTTNCVYIYGDTLFGFSYNTIYKADFANNTNYITQTITTKSIFSKNEYKLQSNTVPISSQYLLCWGEYNNSNGLIYDLRTQSVIGFVITPWCYSTLPRGTAILPKTNLPCLVSEYNKMKLISSAAIAAKKLDTPVVKTTANGMTVTYELEVFY
ncbi:MAG: hypothetical protein RR394_06905 [Oscillospiraceae bacterium]